LNTDESPSLTAWLGRWSRQPVSSGAPANLVGPMLTFNQLVRGEWRDKDVDVVVAENQGVWLWGRDSRGAFLERENEPGAPWLETGEDEDSFWLHHAAFEYLSSRFSAYRSINDAPKADAELVLSVTQPLPCGDWRWPGRRQQMRFRGDSLAMVCDDGEWWWLMLGGPDEASLAWADEIADHVGRVRLTETRLTDP
jgi:hypothetical protein